MNHLPLILTIATLIVTAAFMMLFACCRVSSRDCQVERARVAAREKLRVRLMMEILI